MAPPFWETAVTARRSEAARPPGLRVRRHEATYTRSPSGRASTASLGRINPSAPGSLASTWPLIATTAVSKLRPPSVDLATKVESPWPGRFHEKVV